nr:unnamed protein product [Callosobruchus analis]
MEPRASPSFAKSVSSIQIRSAVQSRYVIINNKSVYFIRRTASNKIRTAKYTLITFLPIFLFEQFRKWSNVFFLLIALLQQVPDLSPTGRYTTIIPLTFIMTVSAVKEIIEDVKRQRDDRDGTWTTQKWRNIKVGEIVRVRCDESFPADLVLLSSSDPDGVCYIETSNLDGESNLKIRQCPYNTKMLTDPKDMVDLSVLMQPEKYNEPLGPYQLLLRGTKLRNTAWIYGVVVYTGHETKLFLNFTKVPYKQSSVDKITNVLMVIMFILFILICILCTVCNYVYHEKLKTHWYLQLEEYSALDVFYNISTFVILFHNVIPISLQVTLEVVRFIQAMFINVDLEMYDEESDIPASARTSNLNDELGQVDRLAEDGLRTLCFAVKNLSKQEYEQWKGFHDRAMSSIYRRPSDLAVIFDQIEQDLVILGASGIEDELQEGVPETIASLREATINIWVLTGDKQQTAINIGDTRRVLSDHIQDLAADTWRGMDVALIIDGKTLSLVLSPRLRDMFMKLCLSCKVVICCRVSPIQKSEVVENVRKNTKAVTLAIGDGANDVAMIRKAHVGIGISGSEGNHAKAASDYSIAQFKYLKKLLFVHGAWSYLRVSKVIMFFFYKNLTFNLIQLWFTLHHEHSGNNMFERWSIGLYNVIFTALQPVVIGVFDKPITAKMTLKNPVAYTYTQGGSLLNLPSFMYWLFVSFTQSLMLYYLTLEMTSHGVLWSEPTYSIYHIVPGCFIYTYLVIVVNLESGRLTDSWPRLMHASIWSSVFGWQTISEEHLSLLKELGSEYLGHLSLTARKAKIIKYIIEFLKSKHFDCDKLIALGCDGTAVNTGDGANDVAMIRKAHVGIGILGAEGRQAAAASDYTIAQFKYLKRLLFIHGAWSYLRVSKVILFFYYKNLVFNLVQLWFTITDEYSGEVMFQEWLIELYNVVFTAAQAVAVGLFDRPCSAEQMLAYPISYTYSQSGKTFCVTRFAYWILISVVQSLLLYYLTMGIMQHDALWSKPNLINYHLLPGCFVYTYIIIVVSLQSGLMTDSWSCFTQLAIWGSIASWFIFISAYSFLWFLIPGGTDMTHVCLMVFTSPYFWLGMFVVPAITLMPDALVCITRHTFFCNVLDKLRLSESKRSTMRRGVFFNFLMSLGGEPEFKLHKSLT